MHVSFSMTVKDVEKCYDRIRVIVASIALTARCPARLFRRLGQAAIQLLRVALDNQTSVLNLRMKNYPIARTSVQQSFKIFAPAL